MRPAVLLLFLLAARAVSAADDPGPALIAEARLVPGALEVMVANRRPAAVSGVTPEVVYQHRTLRDSPATIEPGGSHTWSFELPPALRPGAAAAVIRVRTEGLSPAAAAPVIIALVATPGTAPAAVRATFDAAAVQHAGRAEVRLANPGTSPVDGRVVFVLPDGLATDPQTRPARIAPGGDTSVTLGIENRGALPPGTYAGYVLFEYADGDEQQTAMAKAPITVASPPGSESFPLVVGGLALLAAIATLGMAVRSSARRGPAASAVALALGLGLASPARSATPTDPIRLTFSEGDVSGVTDISDPRTGEPLGLVEYSQTRRGDVLSVHRIARFRDGSSDEDWADARVGNALEAIGGRSVIRDADGVAVAEVHIDVAAGRIRGSWGRDDGRQALDEAIVLPPRTYWGPLIFIVLKEFGANADGGRVAFRTVALTPRPRVFDLEIFAGEAASLERAGVRLEATRYSLAPTVHWLVDPVIRRFLPETSFWMLAGAPPLLVRFEGPRNYTRQPVRIQ
jgi:hypothetical protein